MRLHRGLQLRGTGSSWDRAYLTSNTRPVRMHRAFPGKECCGTDPTGTRNGFPSHVHHALHSLWRDRRYRHMRRLQRPLLPECGCGSRASDRLLQGSMLLREKPIRYPPDKHFCCQRLPVFRDGRMLRSYRWCSKCPCCFSHICPALCCGSLGQEQAF